MFARKLSTILAVTALVVTAIGVIWTPSASAAPTSAGWSAPALENPIHIQMRPGNQNLRLDPNRDYKLEIVEPLTDAGGVVIAGGRNVVLIGGEIRVPNHSDAVMRRAMFLKEQTGTIHIEGVHMSGPYLAEGINLDERQGATVQLRNIKIDKVQGSQAGNHADLLQTWAGPKTLRIDGFQGESNYQGMFLLPRQHFTQADLRDWEFRNVDVRLTQDAGYGFWKDLDHQIALQNVNLSRDGNLTWKSFWPNPLAWAGASFGLPTSSVLGSLIPGAQYSAGLADPGSGTPTTTTPPVTAPPVTAPPITQPPVVDLPESPGSAEQASGYWQVAADGGVFSFGDATFHGSTGGKALNKPVVDMETSASAKGYWLVASDGGVFSFGDAAFLGSTGSMALNRPIESIAATKSGKGYWLVASDGGVFSFGDASFHGSTGSIALNKPIVGMAGTPSGKGYWLVASDGGIFAFGDAGFYGSTGGMAINRPITAMAATPSGKGYWLVASDGGIFAFGDARFYGSAANLASADVTGIRPARSGRGYALDAANGGVFAFGESPFQGSVSGRLNAPVVGSAGF